MTTTCVERRKVVHHQLRSSRLLCHADADSGFQGPTDISFFIVDGSSMASTSSAAARSVFTATIVGPIRYENVRVASEDRLGAEGQGKDIIYHGVSPVYLIGLGAAWHGVARGALENVTEYADRHRPP